MHDISPPASLMFRASLRPVTTFLEKAGRSFWRRCRLECFTMGQDWLLEGFVLREHSGTGIDRSMQRIVWMSWIPVEWSAPLPHPLLLRWPISLGWLAANVLMCPAWLLPEANNALCSSLFLKHMLERQWRGFLWVDELRYLQLELTWRALGWEQRCCQC